MFYLADFSNIEEGGNSFKVPVVPTIAGGAALSGMIAYGDYNQPHKVKIRQKLRARKTLKKKWYKL